MQVDLRFSSPALHGTRCEVIEIQGEETLGRPYHFDIQLRLDGEFDASTLLEQLATLTLEGVEQHRYHGIISHIESWHYDASDGYATVHLIPRLAHLAHAQRSEIYTRQLNMPDLIGKILQTHKLLPERDVCFRLKHTYPPLAHVCQYRESTLDFIQRWLETLGLYYFFEQDTHHERLVICDDICFLPQDTPTLRLRAPQHDDAYAFSRFTQHNTSKPSHVSVQGYDYRKAALGRVQGTHGDKQISATHEVLVAENLTSGVTAPTEQVRMRAQVVAEAHDCQATRYHGSQLAQPVLRNGAQFALTQHPRAASNGTYRVVALRHHATQVGNAQQYPRAHRYQLEFEAIDPTQPFRLPRSTPRPRIAGLVSARVLAVNEEDNRAYLDEQGQYKVQLPFHCAPDDAGAGTIWLRMASPYAGQQHGMHFPLLAGSEVLLAFYDGDPDQAIIVAAAPNSESPNVVTSNNPTQNVLHTPGNNRIEIEDKNGAERMILASPSANSWIRMGAKNDPPIVNDWLAGALHHPQHCKSAFSPSVPCPSGNPGLACGKAVFTTLQARIAKMTDPDKPSALALGGDGKLYTAALNATNDDDDIDQNGISMSTKGGLCSIALGNSDSIAQGNSYKYIGGDTVSMSNGNSQSFTMGNSYTEIQGNAVTYAFNSKNDLTFGAKNEVNAGIKCSREINLNF